MLNIKPGQSKWSLVKRYALAFIFFVIALIVRLQVLPVEAGFAFLAFYPVMAVTFYLCGIGPGVFFAIISAITGYYLFTPPYWSFIPSYQSLVTVSTYSISVVIIGWIISRMQQLLVLLKQSEQRYQGFLEDQTEVICRFKADGTILFVNEAYCRLFGQSAETLIGKRWHPYAWHEDLALINEKLSTLSPANPVVTIEHRVVIATGEIHWVQFINRAFFDEQGVLLETQAVGRDITEQKQAEAEKDELYQRLTQIASSVPGVIYQYKQRPDGSCCFPYASDAIHDIFRVTPEQVQEDGSDVYAVLHPDDYDEIIASIQHSASSLQPWQHEYRVRFPDGTERWLFGNAIPNRLDDGSILWHGYTYDCTDRKIIEQTLQYESEKNQAFLRNASDGISIMDFDGCIVEVSDSFCSMLGYTREEMLGMHVSQWDAVFDESELELMIKQKFENKIRTQIESRHRRKDGSCYDAEISCFPVAIDGKRFVFNSTRDITDRKKLEQQVSVALQEIQDLYDYAPCGYHSIDKNGIILNINETELHWLGYTREEVIGKKKISDFLTPEGQAVFKENFPKFLRDGHMTDQEFELFNKNGEHRQISACATAIKDEKGHFLKSRTVLYDITELKKTQKSLHQLTIEQHAMLNNDLVGIVKLQDRRIVWINKAMERMFGYSLEEIHGQLTKIYYLDDAAYQALGQDCYPILKSSGIYRTQIELLHKNREKIWIDLRTCSKSS